MGVDFKELSVNFLKSSSDKLYSKSCVVPFDKTVMLFFDSSMMMPCEDKISCHFSLENRQEK